MANERFEKIDKSKCFVVYLPIKSEELTCLCEGLSSQHIRQIKNIKYTDKIRANCKKYLKIYKDQQGKIIFIEWHSVEDGEGNLVFLARYKDNIRYLFPFWKDGSFYPTYSYVAKFENGKVVEEYKVEGNQIIYEHYFDESDEKVDFYSINYVPDGKCPIISECEGRYYFNPLRFEMLNSSTWLDYKND